MRWAILCLHLLLRMVDSADYTDHTKHKRGNIMINILLFIAVYIFKPVLYVLCILSTSIATLYIGKELKKQYLPNKPVKQKPNIKPLKGVCYG